jgi:tyrosine-protein kinase Etk/Wzc
MDERVSLLEMLRVLLRSRRVIVLSVLGAALASVVVSLVLPCWYKGVASILPPEGSMEQADVALMMRSAGFKPAFIPGVTTGADVYAVILQSTTVADAVIDSLDLIRVYRVAGRYNARERLTENLRVSVSDQGLVTVAYEDRDALRAAAVTNQFVRELDNFNRVSLVTSARRVREFIENRLADTGLELGRATDDLKVFKEQTGAVLLSEQATASIKAAADIYAKIAELEVGLARVRQFATDKSPEVIDIRTQIGALDRKLAEMGLMDSEGGPAAGSRLFPRFDAAPDLEQRLASLMMNVEVKGSVYKVLSEQYEVAKIQETRDTPTIQVVDWATEPMIRSKPKRKVIVLVSSVSALLLACIVVLARERSRGFDPRDREALAEIGTIVSGDLRRVRRLFGGSGKRPDA